MLGFHPVIILPKKYPIFNLSKHLSEKKILKHKFGIGKYNEKRLGTYKASLFKGGRNIHMGIDFFAPIGTPLYAFEKGEIFLTGYNSAKGDYGYTLITKHQISGVILFALYGHLSKVSIEKKRRGEKIEKGQVIAWVGERQENGGWIPHLHFQLSFERPLISDLPGVVSQKDLSIALLKYPDPRLVLGPIY